MSDVSSTALVEKKADALTPDEIAALSPYFKKRLTRIRKNWREVVEDLVFQYGHCYHNGRGKFITTGGLSTLEGAFAALGWDDPHYVKEGGCEHPKCKAWDTCGTPTPDGYKRLCSDHYRATIAVEEREAARGT
jgi:hypothetical protein